jgi:hypothetical protein
VKTFNRHVTLTPRHKYINIVMACFTVVMMRLTFLLTNEDCHKKLEIAIVDLEGYDPIVVTMTVNPSL